MKQNPILIFKTKFMVLLERFRKPEAPICVTHHESPTGEAIRTSLVLERSAWIGSMKDSIEILGDIISPANEESEWEALRD
jgi:hypothetical protein